MGLKASRAAKDRGSTLHPTICFHGLRSRVARLLRPRLEILDSLALAPFRHCLWVMPSSQLSVASEACDRCIAALTECVVVALP